MAAKYNGRHQERLVSFNFHMTPLVSFSGSYAFGSAFNPYFVRLKAGLKGILGFYQFVEFTMTDRVYLPDVS